MKIMQSNWDPKAGWTGLNEDGADIVLVFGARSALSDRDAIDRLRRAHPRALFFGCSTAGEIYGTQVRDDSIAATAVRFERTMVRRAEVELADPAGSFDAGARLAEALTQEGLRHVFVLSDGLKVNGSELVRGFRERLPAKVAVTGGLSGDGSRFEKTLVLLDDGPREGRVAALGFYGPQFHVGYGSLGGWDPFGPERRITRSKGNVLFELDGMPALQLYKRYLGEYASGLPASGLLFPLTLRTEEPRPGVVRTLLAVDEKEQSVTFAGDVPEGSFARLMKANFERLIDGATGAAGTARLTGDGSSAPPELAVLISCVGRKLILKQRIEEEVEGVRDVLGPQVALTGFYSYGEICPFTPSARCELHNQTMTITTFSER